MEKTVVGGVFKSSEEALHAIERLRAVGFDAHDISVMAKDKDKVDEIDENTDADLIDESSKRGKNAGKGLGIGAGTGGVLGGVAGLIAEVGLLTIPGIGVLAAAGPLATTLSGLAIGATGGGLVGALTGAGIPEENAKEYEKYLKDGNILLLVDIDDEQREDIQQIFSDSHSVTTDVYTVQT